MPFFYCVFHWSEQRRCDARLRAADLTAPDRGSPTHGIAACWRFADGAHSVEQPMNRIPIVTKRRPAVFARLSDLFAPQRAEQIILMPQTADGADSASGNGARDTAALRPARLRDRRGARPARHDSQRARSRARRPGERCATSRGNPAA
jgi:hypothetical protein